jgi:hypothetical protein
MFAMRCVRNDPPRPRHWSRPGSLLRRRLGAAAFPWRSSDLCALPSSPARTNDPNAFWFDPALRGRLPVYVAVPVLPHLHARVAEYPGALAEGGANFRDGLHLVPVTRGFWHAGLQFQIFPTRHHLPETCFGLRLPGSFVFTGDTRPIPEMLARYADAGEPVAHDCGPVGNPSHTGVDDLEREYPPELRACLLLYHYGSEADGAALAARSCRVARPGEAISLAAPLR